VGKRIWNLGYDEGYPKLDLHAFRRFVATTILNKGIELKGSSNV
jgi:hypothetical protein